MKRYCCAFAVLALLFSCAKEQTAIPVKEEKEADAQEVLPDVSIVKFSDDMVDLIESDLNAGKVITKSAQLNSMVDELGIVSMVREFPNAGKFEPRTRAAGLHKWYVVTYGAKTSVTKADNYLSSVPGIDIVEPDHKIKIESTYFNDSYYSSQWDFCSPGTSSYLPGADINVEPVWKNYTTGNPDVIVAVIDGGIDLTHEDLADNVIPGGVNGSKNFVSGYIGYDIVAHNHGTHVAGTIAAINNNGKGVCGVAGGDYAKGQKGVRLLSCQIFMKNPADPTKDISGSGSEAIKWACDHGAVIANNSWAYTYDNEDQAKSGVTSQSLKDAIDYFIKYAGYDENGTQTGPMAGGVVFFASGNDGWSVGHPADYQSVVAVGSITSKLTRSTFSNYGDWVDICAPGGGGGFNIRSTIPGNSYGYMAGTSMACPHVSGVAALIVSYYGGKGFTNEQLKERLLGGANSTILPANSQIGPLVDAMGAFSYATQDPPTPISSYTVSSNSNNVDLTFKVTASSNGEKAYGYLLIASKDKTKLENFVPTSTAAEGVTIANVLTDVTKTGEELTGTIRGLDFSSDYYVGIIGYNYHKKYSTLSPIKTATTGINHPPVITAETNPPYKVKSNETKVFSFNISDPDGHKLDVSFAGGSSAATASFNSDSTKCDVSIYGGKATAGTYNAKFIATDSYDAFAVFPFQYVIYENQAPYVANPVADMIVDNLGTSTTLDLSKVFSDPDDNDIKYYFRGNDEGVLKMESEIDANNGGLITGSNITFSSSSYGLATMTLIARDPAGKEAILSFQVLVKDSNNPAETYPNPVTNYLYVRTEASAETNIKIMNSSGAVLLDKTQTVSGFKPAKVDMTKCAPGVYGVSITYSGKSYKKSIVKK